MQDWDLSDQKVRIRDLKSKIERTQHNIMQNDGATTSPQQINGKSKESLVVRPFHYFSPPELTKRMRQRDLTVLLGHPGVRPHPHGRCVCIEDRILVSSPSPLEIERADREISGQPSQNRKQREGSRRLTVVRRVSDQRSKVRDWS